MRKAGDVRGILGGPETEQIFFTTREGGTPWRPSHVSGGDGDTALSEIERQLAITRGLHLAETAEKLAP